MIVLRKCFRVHWTACPFADAISGHRYSQWSDFPWFFAIFCTIWRVILFPWFRLKKIGMQMISYICRLHATVYMYRLRSNVTPGILSVCLHLKFSEYSRPTFYTRLPVLWLSLVRDLLPHSLGASICLFALSFLFVRFYVYEHIQYMYKMLNCVPYACTSTYKYKHATTIIVMSRIPMC
jgi:hypothetical protein